MKHICQIGVVVVLCAIVLSGCQGSQTQNKPEQIEVVYPAKENKTPANSNVDKPQVAVSAPENKATCSSKVEPTVCKPEAKKDEVGKTPDKVVVATPTPVPVAITKESPAKETEKKPTEQPKTDVEKKVEPAKKPEEAGKKTDTRKYFYLRIISYSHHPFFQKRAEDIVKHLKNQGIEGSEARVSSDSKGEKYWVVDIGKFESPNAAKAKEVKEKVQAMKYEGNTYFKDAYYVER